MDFNDLMAAAKANSRLNDETVRLIGYNIPNQ